MNSMQRWIPAALLSIGCLLNSTLTARRAESTPLRSPLAGVAPSLLGARGIDDTVDAEQRRVAGMTSYVMRHYDAAGYLPFSIYVGYYDEQHQGKSIHSPRNCLPGAGWEPVESGATTIITSAGAVTVNRYRIANGKSQALVYYWYQGRGRVAHDELRVKFELLRDAIMRGRTEEALVRVVVDLNGEADAPNADRTARAIISALVGDVNRVLPTF